MSKYDKIFNSKDTSAESLSPEEAVAAIAVITALAESSFDEVEAERVVISLWEFELFDEYSEEEIGEIVERLLAIAEDDGVGALFNIARASLSDEIVLDGFAAGVIMVLDEEELIIPSHKQLYLKNLEQALELEEEEAQEIIQEVIDAFEAAESDYTEDEDDIFSVIMDEYTGHIYESPLDNFAVPIPVQPQHEGKIQSQEGIVSFSDDQGTFLRIDYYPLPPEQFAEIESQGLEKYLRFILIDTYLPQVIFANVPGAEVKYAEYLEDILGGYYYALVDMPKGSTISKQENNGTGMRLDAYRGMLAFIQNDFFYIVSSQRSFFNGNTPGSVKQEAESIKENILEFVETIEFRESTESES